MPFIEATTRPLLWACQDGVNIIATGVTEIGALTVTGEDKVLLSDADEIAFLGKVAGKAGSYTPLPDLGEWLEAGAIYADGDGLVIVRQAHTRTEHNPADVPALFAVYRTDAGEALDWVAGEGVSVGTRRLYGGKLYQALQRHVTQADWTPPATPALWVEVVETPPTGEWAVGVAYKVGDEVTYQGVTYRCRQAHTSISTWTPPATLSLWLPL